MKGETVNVNDDSFKVLEAELPVSFGLLVQSIPRGSSVWRFSP